MHRFLGFVSLALAATAIAISADARPPPGGETAGGWWFRSLKQPNGESCCAESPDGLPDCHRLDLTLVREVGDGARMHWQFKATPAVFLGLGDDKWHDIPDEVLIRGRKLAELGGNVTDYGSYAQ